MSHMEKLTLAAALAALAAAAASSSPASTEDMLPVRHGIFVDSRISCKEFARAYVAELQVANKYAMSFWGDSINDAFTVGRITRVYRDGSTYRVRLDAKGDGPMGSFKGTVEQSLVVSSPTKIRTDHGFGEATFRWCYAAIP